jgi:dCMP deaminase
MNLMEALAAHNLSLKGSSVRQDRRRLKMSVIAKNALNWAKMGTCPRLHVGAVIFTKDFRQLSSGYTGSLSGASHCKDTSCLVIDDHCVSTLHAEMNAIMQAAREGVDINGAMMMVTHAPCLLCTKLILQSGISAVYYLEPYGKREEQDLAEFFFREMAVPRVLFVPISIE